MPFPTTDRRATSSKLGEENVRIRAARARGQDEKADTTMRDVTPDDDEGSVVTELKKNHNSCGACRTRETETWWKAPKGLATPVLCDNCGLGWRKYADLNVRPLREEQLPKAKAAAGSTEMYKKTLARLEKIQSHLETAPRSGRLKDKVCIITGVGSLKGIGCVARVVLN